ncbi:MAG: UDP-N-acetylglucosamine 1-carboxyvinyltransferase, partial [Sediminibacterium sp.]|nr:UDP-N-acetylglucosamine 1-carboxyvinyltransferase [Sediminibacterium sp.]
MSSFEVIGGNKLKGEIIPQGAKNEALQILSAVVLTNQPVTISNIPDILDVNLLIELLGEIGVKIKRNSSDTYTFQANQIDAGYLASEAFRKKSGRLRGSVMLAGPMLARFHTAYIPKPGGDKIGRRRLDTHIIGFQKLGAAYAYNDALGCFTLTADHLKGAYMLLDEPSVTGTANIVMAAVLAEGITTIYNAACEPYLQQLCSMLNRMGAKISGIGSNLLTIEGVSTLTGTQHRLLPDMIEIGSFIGLAAMTQSEITIKDAGVEHLGIIPEKFSQLGIQFEIR